MMQAVQYFQRLEASKFRQMNERSPLNGITTSNKVPRPVNNRLSPRMDKVDEVDGLMVVVSIVTRMEKEITRSRRATGGAAIIGRLHIAMLTKRAEATQGEESTSNYPYSDEECKNEEYKVVIHVLATLPKQPPPMRLRIRISKAKEEHLALVDSGCSTSFINGSLLKISQMLGYKLQTSTVTVLGQRSKFRFPTLSASSLITHSFAVIPNAKDEIIIGRNLLSALYMIVSFRDAQIDGPATTAN
ncbi:hypothetical protein KXD40_009586 [Peronospora effusa]|nr:hypothetical protein KXD40_009586 [Peronospora effusa]